MNKAAFEKLSYLLGPKIAALDDRGESYGWVSAGAVALLTGGAGAYVAYGAGLATTVAIGGGTGLVGALSGWPISRLAGKDAAIQLANLLGTLGSEFSDLPDGGTLTLNVSISYTDEDDITSQSSMRAERFRVRVSLGGTTIFSQSCGRLGQCAGAEFVDILNQVISDPDQWSNNNIGISNVR